MYAEEQREYYVKQFETMMPDLKGTISGPRGKEFFEKSKLPRSDLSKIWQLSDADCDGCLSLEEFCTAMHLVILRRNQVKIPERLPIQLQPYEMLTADGEHLQDDEIEPNSDEFQTISQKDDAFQQYSSTTEEEELTGRPKRARPVAFDAKPPVVYTGSLISAFLWFFLIFFTE